MHCIAEDGTTTPHEGTTYEMPVPITAKSDPSYEYYDDNVHSRPTATTVHVRPTSWRLVLWVLAAYEIVETTKSALAHTSTVSCG